MTEQAIDALDFPIDCRFPNCKHSAIRADMEAHELVCEYGLKECWWCNQRVAIDTHEGHERHCAREELIRLQETDSHRQYQFRPSYLQAYRAMRRRAALARVDEHHDSSGRLQETGHNRHDRLDHEEVSSQAFRAMRERALRVLVENPPGVTRLLLRPIP